MLEFHLNTLSLRLRMMGFVAYISFKVSEKEYLQKQSSPCPNKNPAPNCTKDSKHIKECRVPEYKF